MNAPRQTMRSPYMEFAKLRSSARFNLAASGVKSFPLAGFPVTLDQLEIDGPTTYGYPPLQERLAKKNDVAANCVVAATGTSMANHLAMAALLKPGDEVLIEEPTYELLLSAARYLGAEVRRFPRRAENRFGIDLQELRSLLTLRTKLIVITNLHNPSSALVSDTVLAGIGDMARDAGAKVLVDEVYLEALFDQPHRSAFHLGNHFVVTNSLTKAYGLSGLRCGWVLAEPALAERIWRLNDLFGATPAHPAERLSVIALDHLQLAATRAREILEVNRRALNNFLDSRPELETFKPPFGTTVFPRLRNGDVDEFCKLLREKYETSVVPGKFFEMPNHFRIGIGGDSEMTVAGLERLGQALDEFSKRK